MHASKAFIAGIFAGISSPGSVGTKGTYIHEKSSDLLRIRKDVKKIGSDFAYVIERQHGPVKIRKSSR